jgi:hypothetical protein
MRRACNNEIVKSSFNPTQIAGSASKFLEDDFAGPPQLGVRGAKFEVLEQVKRLRLGAGGSRRGWVEMRI